MSKSFIIYSNVLRLTKIQLRAMETPLNLESMYFQQFLFVVSSVLWLPLRAEGP